MNELIAQVIEVKLVEVVILQGHDVIFTDQTSLSGYITF